MAPALTSALWSALSITLGAQTALGADWSEGFVVPVGGRPNPYAFSEADRLMAWRTGRLHTLHYPVELTGMLIPYEPVRSVIEGADTHPLRRWIASVFRGFSGIRKMDDVYARVGLVPYPTTVEPESSVFHVPRPARVPASRLGRMGTTLITDAQGATGFTFSCAACHASQLFGRPVIGLTNRFPRANEFFLQGKKGIARVSPEFFRATTGATEAETRLFIKTRHAARFVFVEKPLALGLDTSLSQVALSLARRGQDPYAEREDRWAESPRPDPLMDAPADSKPAVWWNLKYKNRWLADGSVISGNPIYTNILWNEIGRGADLRELEGWLARNGRVIEELTTAVFSSEAPRYTDYFPASRIDAVRAKRGQRVFDAQCARCHGQYEKAWDITGADALPWSEQIRTIEVRYPRQTRVVDVGTDPWRWRGMESLAKALNPLAISRANGIVIRPEQGYVPPPLVGIWARWPYFHNNSIPSLCAVLTRASQRPQVYWSGPANDPDRDFDDECNGYPSGRAVPRAWRASREHRFDTRRVGLSNSGHDEGIFLESGRELLTADDKLDLIHFLKTL